MLSDLSLCLKIIHISGLQDFRKDLKDINSYLKTPVLGMNALQYSCCFNSKANLSIREISPSIADNITRHNQVIMLFHNLKLLLLTIP